MGCGEEASMGTGESLTRRLRLISSVRGRH